MAFADVSDIQARWRTLTSAEQARAAVLAEDASAMLASMVDFDVADLGQMELLKVVCCNMVIRAMSASESEAFGADSMTVTAGPYTQTYSYSNPSGDMYLTRAEKRMLGVSGGYIGSIRPMMAGGRDD